MRLFGSPGPSLGKGRLVAALGLCLLLLTPSTAIPQAPGACARVGLTHRPGWVTSGTWVANGRRLAMVDSTNETVVLYGRTGRSLGVVSGPSGEMLRDISPRLIKSLDDHRMVVQTVNDRLVTLDAHFAPMRRAAVLGHKSAANRVGLLGMFQWEPVGKGEIVSFSDLELENPRPPRWGTGFVRFSLADPESFTVLRQGTLEGPERVFNRLGYQYIAALGDKAYVLLMGEGTELYESSPGDPGLRRLEAFRSQPTPDLPPFDEWREYPAVMRAVERSSMPAGLYGWNGYLYMLSRKPLGAGTEWSLTKLDPGSGRELGTAILPTAANHLTLIPGPREWAVLEKGPVLGPGRQTIGTMLLIPAQRLTGRLTGDVCN